VKISISAKTAPLLGNSRASSPSWFNRGAEKLQQIRSNRGPRLLPTISFVENNSPAKAGLVGGKLLDLYKRGRKTQNRGKTKNWRQTEQKYRAKKQNTEKRRKSKGAGQIGVLAFPLFSSLLTKEKPGISQRKLTAGRHHLRSFKSYWENKRKIQTSENRRKTKRSSRRESSSALQASSVSRSRYACFFIHFCIFISNWIVTRTVFMHAWIHFTRAFSFFFAQPGHWLGLVTGLGWLGLAQSMWDELGPAQKYELAGLAQKNKKNKKQRCVYV